MTLLVGVNGMYRCATQILRCELRSGREVRSSSLCRRTPARATGAREVLIMLRYLNLVHGLLRPISSSKRNRCAMIFAVNTAGSKVPVS